MRSLNLFIIAICAGVLFFSACKSKKKAASTGQVSLEEDLSLYRPTFTYREVIIKKEGEAFGSASDTSRPKLHINKKAKEALQYIAEKNKKIEHAMGYRIQVYTGRDRDKANEIKSKLYKTVENPNIYMDYEAPNFKVKVGDFMSRFEAQQLREEILTEFSSAMVVRDKIKIKIK